jgi:DNA-binding XRE family transcriptional regulator
MTQKQLAETAKVDEASLSQLENGRKNPEWATVRRLADALAMKVSEIAAREEAIEARDA